ncbi:MAG TPA: rhomboid-like protein [Gaiellaceae bacterium]|nr:rhomboid-like protein [Gaiellaceae bacterium]
MTKLRLVRLGPVSAAFLALMSVTTIVLASLGASQRQQLLLTSSTDLARLEHDPLRVLALSILWETPRGFLTLVIPTVLLLAAVEWRVGSLRAFAVLAAGHVGGTLLAALGIVAGINHGTLAPNVADVVDVGVSYATYALIGYAGFLLAGRARLLFLTPVALILVAGVAIDRDFTSVGHLFSAVIGIALGLGGFGRRAARPRLALALVGGALLMAPLAGWIELSG